MITTSSRCGNRLENYKTAEARQPLVIFVASMFAFVSLDGADIVHFLCNSRGR